MSVEETLAAIDAAVGCQQCGRPLAGSVSDDFDSEECQAEWHAARALRLGDGEPMQVDIASVALEAGWATILDSGVTYALDPNRAASRAAAFERLLRSHGAAATNDHGHPRPEIATREVNE